MLQLTTLYVCYKAAPSLSQLQIQLEIGAGPT